MVPALGVAAHAAASARPPTASAVLLCVFLGLIAAVAVDGLSRVRRLGWFALCGVLTVAQGITHLALSVGDHGAGAAPTSSHAMSGDAMDHAAMGHPGMGHGSSMPAVGDGMLAHHLHELMTPWSADGLVMVLTHLVAVPLAAILIALAAAVTSVATSTVAALTDRGPQADPLPRLAPAVAAVVVCVRIDRAAGPGKRGPPGVLAPTH
ncbi:hypothetical protein [Williamsia deligens]|uniref:Uncharacterized protein n=1 Tax=Williamsia deligens TaxID=321325 RepID=A0ABW3G8I0_9NOCA|nr:hypothetical protein [Williamsia deligens]MCP2193903.1 hypothetical protein [Williamsia deligens]